MPKLFSAQNTKLTPFFAPLALSLLLSACGGGGGSSGSATAPSTPSTSSSFSGIAQLGYIEGATVKLIDLQGALVAQTISGENGAFTFANANISSSEIYVLQVSGGNDVDINDDGVRDATPTPLLQTVHGVYDGAALAAGNVKINVISDMLYRHVEVDIQRKDKANIQSQAATYLANLVEDVGSRLIINFFNK